jgi:RNA polymerase sigma-70 factor (ECF subfamily)
VKNLEMNFRTDNYYIGKIKQGDPSAYAVLVDKYKKLAYNVALQLTENREDAEEVAQDAFVKAYQALDTYKGDSKFSTWLYRIVYNTAISRMRKKKLNTKSIDEDYSTSVNVIATQSSVKKMEVDERKKFINLALERMNGDEKSLLTLFYLEENSVDEVSQVTGLSISNVKVKLHRARKKLYLQLEALLQSEVKAIL